QNNANAVTTAQTGLNNARAAVKSLEAELRTATSYWTKFGTAMTNFGNVATNLGRTMRRTGMFMTRYITTAVVSLGTMAVKSSIDFEDSFASVEKVIHGTAEEMEALRQTSKDMSTEKPIDTSTINNIMMTAGQLGVAKENVKAFTDVIADLSLVGNNVEADEAATSIARFANITQGAVRAGKDSEQYFQNLGSTVYYLGNTMATTEPEIITMGQRLAAAGYQVGMTDADIMALAATLSSLGIQAQAGGTAFSKMLINMESAVAHGGEALNDFAKVSGMSASDFSKQWKDDPMVAIQAFFNGIAELDEEGQSAILTLEELGIKEVRLRDAMLRTANANTLLVDASEKANAAWADGNKLTNAAQTRYKTLKNQMTMLKNQGKLLAQTFGDDLTPKVQEFVDWAEKQISSLMSLSSEQRMGMMTNMAWVAGLGVALKLGGSFLTTVGGMAKGIGAFAKTVGEASTVSAGLAKATHGLISPTTGMIALAAALGVAAYAFFDYISGAKQAREALEALQAQADEWSRTRATTI
ncbi:MAG: phage tail tape measure protein, partial [Aquamicrobium sp.]|nr:phage tail tape measure protein [Aquamicrobium sp.]